MAVDNAVGSRKIWALGWIRIFSVLLVFYSIIVTIEPANSTVVQVLKWLLNHMIWPSVWLSYQIREGVRSHYPNLGVPGSNQFEPELDWYYISWTRTGPNQLFSLWLTWKTPWTGLNQTWPSLVKSSCMRRRMEQLSLPNIDLRGILVHGVNWTKIILVTSIFWLE